MGLSLESEAANAQKVSHPQSLQFGPYSKLNLHRPV